MPGERSRVVVGMSGGVDSSLAAALLVEQGCEVIGATMLVWSPPGVDMEYADSCCGLSAAEDARRVCHHLGIRHYVLDLRDEFYDRIVRNYVEEYLQGRTPNPCVRCNEFLKFRALLDRARALGADAVATGHYARIRFSAERHRYLLLRGVDGSKDQSYALYRLSQEQLSRTRLPLGEWRKEEVRGAARQRGLPTAGKPDSQETCFIPGNDYPRLLQILAPEARRPGEFVSPEGKVLGRHGGIAHYTIGQRKRINVGSPVPLYVSEIRPEAGEITVCPANHPALLHRVARARQVNLIGLDPSRLPEEPLPVQAKIRYQCGDLPGRLTFSGNGDELSMQVEFAEPVRAVTPGQSLVCYQGEELLVGGILAT
ncbi:MAG: tRNA 2-thiouridine(34) synthase MnmA [Armatimonadetes bacterium]|nr:tRNA 2-thiouridine(34) synthase MnmA [Armatimonadota bacterium]